MPIYEEKLVSPLAIRFTQEHIRTTFRDGRVVENSINEITSGPGVGGYDVVLRVPFPSIEILRWNVPRHDADLDAELNCPVGVRPREHWFTLDNRRLYCLQRAAVSLWPSRVAAVVAIMYADPGTVRKKFDSTSLGWSVCIGNSYEELPIARWDWRERVLPLEVGAAGDEDGGVLEAMLSDDRKRTVGQLLDAPAAGAASGASAADPTAGGSSSSTAPAGKAGPGCPTPSTADVSDESGEERDGRRRGRERGRAQPAAGEEPGADAYNPAVANAVREIKQQINARGADGRVRIPQWDDRYGPHLGPLRSFIESRPDKFALIPGEGGDFTVEKARRRGRDAPESAGGAGADGAGPAGLEAAALAEIEEQLSGPKRDGRISIAHWRERYEGSLGSVRSFLKRWPDRFTVIAGEGRHFRVVRKGEGTAMHAIREIEEKLGEADYNGCLEVPQWEEQYAAELGSLAEFLATCPEKFSVVSTADGVLQVARARDEAARRALREVEAQLQAPDYDGRLNLPHWEEVYGETLGSLRRFLERRPEVVVSVDEDDQLTVVRRPGDVSERALLEIEELLADPRHDGRLRVPRWKERYREALGPLRAFLEGFPGRFRVVPGEGAKFIVVKAADVLAVKALHEIDMLLCGPCANGYLEVPRWDELYAPTLGPLRTFLESWPSRVTARIGEHGRLLVSRVCNRPLVEALAEIEAHLQAQGGTGHVHIPEWSARYGTTLGGFKSFVESMSGKFTVLPEQGSRFSVALAPEAVVASACADIEAQCRLPGYDGFVQVPDWGERYSPFLGTLRQFLGSHPERFSVTYIGSVLYTYLAPQPPPDACRGGPGAGGAASADRPPRAGAGASAEAAGAGAGAGACAAHSAGGGRSWPAGGRAAEAASGPRARAGGRPGGRAWRPVASSSGGDATGGGAAGGAAGGHAGGHPDATVGRASGHAGGWEWRPSAERGGRGYPAHGSGAGGTSGGARLFGGALSAIGAPPQQGRGRW